MTLLRCLRCGNLARPDPAAPCGLCGGTSFQEVAGSFPPARYRPRPVPNDPDEAPEIGDASEFDDPPPQRPRLRLILGGGDPGATLPPDPQPPREPS